MSICPEDLDTRVNRRAKPYASSTGIVAIARILTVKKAALSIDVSWDSSPVSYFSVIEVNVAIICACVVTLRPLLADVFPNLIRSSYAQNRYYGAEPTVMPGTRRSLRYTTKHADHGIYGLADLEANQVLNGSQEGLTSKAFFEPAHLATHELSGPGNSTSTVASGPLPSASRNENQIPAAKIHIRPGDIVVTRETVIREEIRTMSPASPRLREEGGHRWLASSPKSSNESASNDSSAPPLLEGWGQNLETDPSAR